MDWALDPETNLPTENGILYLLMAMGVLKPKSLAGLPTVPWIKKLIRDNQQKLQKSEPGSDRAKEFTEWLSGVPMAR